MSQHTGKWTPMPPELTRAMIDAAQAVEEDGYEAMYQAMKANRPQPCRFHDYDTEACETYSGDVPCEPEPSSGVPEVLAKAVDMLEDYASALGNGDLDGAGHSTIQDIHEVIDLLTAAPTPEAEIGPNDINQWAGTIIAREGTNASPSKNAIDLAYRIIGDPTPDGQSGGVLEPIAHLVRHEFTGNMEVWNRSDKARRANYYGKPFPVFTHPHSEQGDSEQLEIERGYSQALERRIAELERGDGEQAGEWVRCDERLPTEADADSEGNVWARVAAHNEVSTLPPSIVQVFSEDGKITHWKPTGLTRPQPPKSKEDSGHE